MHARPNCGGRVLFPLAKLQKIVYLIPTKETAYDTYKHERTQYNSAGLHGSGICSDACIPAQMVQIYGQNNVLTIRITMKTVREICKKVAKRHTAKTKQFWNRRGVLENGPGEVNLIGSIDKELERIFPSLVEILKEELGLDIEIEGAKK
jgi:hypothetical protein